MTKKYSPTVYSNIKKSLKTLLVATKTKDDIAGHILSPEKPFA